MPKGVGVRVPSAALLQFRRKPRRFSPKFVLGQLFFMSLSPVKSRCWCLLQKQTETHLVVQEPLKFAVGAFLKNRPKLIRNGVEFCDKNKKCLLHSQIDYEYNKRNIRNIRNNTGPNLRACMLFSPGWLQTQYRSWQSFWPHGGKQRQHRYLSGIAQQLHQVNSIKQRNKR